MIEAVASLNALIDRTGPVSGPSSAGLLQGVLSPAPTAIPTGPAFGDVMAQIASGMRDTLRAGEATAIAGLQGKASAQQVVEAVLSAEQSLQTAIAIRDKVVAAYLEISRMAI
ncbi:flagellar hook-basal body complex protein FliE [Methylobacterium sp. WSM2598]|uniref:flagellar hook-basal body complex protein FliE n=1 Tax=Methylobacterium sp. WSM2598 TaxID=398261 RepID=UPI00036DCF9F|nr:flagellar hook-basal body complex protein FliE [Methylobacterium sp. WSM2598]